MRYKITIEYDGKPYVGWQKQNDLQIKSVEEVLQNAIFCMTQEEVKIHCAGRTDAGVHAISQIAHFDLQKEFEPFRMMMGINQYLRSELIIVAQCEIVDENFHSRFSAKSRSYVYHIINRKAPLALHKNHAWHVPVDLDVAAMNLAAQYLVGEHDFSSFRDAACQSNSAIRIVHKISVTKKDDDIFVEIEAKSFLHHMVRNIVGTLVWVGNGRIAIDDVLVILNDQDRTKSGPNAPAHGLYFLGAKY